MKDGRRVICESCWGEITEGRDLVVANISRMAEPYHVHCYEDKLKSMGRFSRLFYWGSPINGFRGNIDLTMSLIINIALLIIFGIEYWPVIATITVFVVFVRLYSWFKYENAVKPIPRDKSERLFQRIGRGVGTSLRESFIGIIKFYIVVIGSMLLGTLLADLAGNIF